MSKVQLRLPGPTPLPDRVLRALGRQMIDHRGPEFEVLLEQCVTGLQWALKTRNDVLLFPASGTGGLEAAAANLLSPGEPVLVGCMGWFGAMWADICEAFGAQVFRFEVPWGSALNPTELDRALATRPEIRKVFVTHNETSTAVASDMVALAESCEEARPAACRRQCRRRRMSSLGG